MACRTVVTKHRLMVVDVTDHTPHVRVEHRVIHAGDPGGAALLLTMARKPFRCRRMKSRIAAIEQAGVPGMAADALHRWDTPEGHVTGPALTTQGSVCRTERAWRTQPAHPVEPRRGLSPHLGRPGPVHPYEE